MSVLRVYDPAECDKAGVPLDWEQCRTCVGTGNERAREFARADTADGPVFVVPADVEAALASSCETCGGYGSLKAAALAGRWAHARPTFTGSFLVRCEDCGHSMSEGAWEPETEGYRVRGRLARALDAIKRGEEPPTGSPNLQGALVPIPVHYSPCDEGCRHGLPARWAELDDLVPGAPRGVFEEAWDDVPGSTDPDGHDEVRDLLGAGAIEASWRPVEVRTLGWPHDLRPEKLAVLCLRCWAARRG